MATFAQVWTARSSCAHGGGRILACYLPSMSLRAIPAGMLSCLYVATTNPGGKRGGRDRDRGSGCPLTPPTPPYVRSRIRRFHDLSPGGPEVRYPVRRWRFRRSQVSFGLHPILPWQAPPERIGWRIAIQDNRVLLFTITVRAFLALPSTTP